MEQRDVSLGFASLYRETEQEALEIRCEVPRC